LRLEAVKSPGLAHASYYLSDAGEAVVVDPRRDVEAYVRLAREDCAKIQYVLETHRNEDYVVGSLELKEAAGAEICHSKDTPFGYGDHNLTGNEVIAIGSLRIKPIPTPGHTFDSICYAVSDTRNSPEPFMVFTGDTLFVGDVGRTDLPGAEHKERLSGLLFDGIHGKLVPLGDHVLVYPGHTAGSVCGSRIGDREVTTIGIERRTNPLLRLERDAFIRNRMGTKIPRPPYFLRMEEWNLNGAPSLRYASIPKHLPVQDFESLWRQPDAIVVDTRSPEAFAASHIPGSLSIWLAGTPSYTGWAVDYNDRILLVVERREDAETATAYLHRIGFDEIVGYLCPGVDGWRNRGRFTESIGVLTAPDLKDVLGKRSVTLIDVRDAEEYASGHIPSASNIYVGNIDAEARNIPGGDPVVVTCAWGGRGSLAASILKRRGFREVINLLGGTNAWRALGYPVETV
jgi:hydroxyacylglutathione hydrolase